MPLIGDLGIWLSHNLLYVMHINKGTLFALSNYVFHVKSEVPLHTQTGKDAKFDCRRNGSRLNLEKKCTLYHNGVKYPCITKNISISGVLVSAHDFPPAKLELGDTCVLSFSNDTPSAIGEYESKVTRLDLSMVALSFLNLTF